MTAGARGGFAALDACVHCGFCLQACPTFLATGDEADGPRGRIELMRALERGELDESDSALARHLDRCLGCRGCEPVCPSGVGYGFGLEAARERLARRRGVPLLARLALAAMTTPKLSRAFYALARALRATGLPARIAGWSRWRFGMGMLASTRPQRRGEWGVVRDGAHRISVATRQEPLPTPHSPVLLFRGCVMDGLFAHVHDATIRTLGVNGYEVREVEAQVCCGALHAHAGMQEAARSLARANVAAFGDGDDPVVVNSAGCGAQLKAYGHVLEDPGGARFAARVRDVTELLVERGPAPGALLGHPLRVAYDAPCHLAHAQRVIEAPLTVLRAVPGLDLSETADSAQCCGSAGLYTLLEPALSREVLAPKLARLLEAPPDVVATGNPGCLMQIGSGLLAARAAVSVRHPVELLDLSYRAAGRYA
jgi:glycolate oxidase iron-sulfur subunit